MPGLLFVLSGPSGAGKTSLAKELTSRIPNAAQLVTTTTRRPREGEIDGVHYHFMPRDSFLRGIAAGDFIEHAEVYGNLYGASHHVVEAMREAHEYVFAVVDVQGAAAYKKHIPDAFTLFLRPSLEDVERRIRALRTDAPEDEVARRLALAKSEIAKADSFDAVIENHEGCFDEAVHDALAALFARA